MAEVDRRGFFRILRRADTAAAEPADPGAPSEKDLQVGQLADLTLRLLADVDAENDERLAEGTLMTVPCDLPEPEEPPAEEGAATGPEPEPTGGPRP